LLGETSGSRAEEVIKSVDRVLRAAEQEPTFFISLGGELKDKLEVASPQDRASLARSLDLVLQRVRSESDDFRQLSWVADTFFNLAGGYEATDTAVTPDSKRYFEESIATYEKMLKGNVPPQYKIQTEFRMAKTLQRIEDFEKSLRILFDVLKDRTMMLEVQQEAARTFQRWGVKTKDPEKLRVAIVGTGNSLKFEQWGDPPKTFQAKGDAAKRLRNGVVWGWNNLSKLTAVNPKFKAVFYQSRYDLADSRFQLALAQADGPTRHKTMLQAKRDIVFTEQLYSLGSESSGTKLEAEFDALLKKIQKALKEKPDGLQAIRADSVDKKSAG
jgi:tetratricopeptide (TPR) repeat protein